MNRTRAIIHSADTSMYRYPYQNHSLADMENEIWKPVPDFEEYYAVSNLGRVKRLARQTGYNDGRKTRLLEERIVHTGIIKRYSKQRNEFRCQLSFTAITENGQRSMMVARTVYSVTRNLREGLFIIPFSQPGIKGKAAAAARKKVSQYDLLGHFIRSFPSIREAERQTGISSTGIQNVAREKQKHAGGFIWRHDTEIQKLDDPTLAKYSNPTQVKINQ